jgi:cytochrome c oxidase cbb3-type subunit 3
MRKEAGLIFLTAFIVIIFYSIAGCSKQKDTGEIRTVSVSPGEGQSTGVTSGKAVYEKYCKACHGEGARGDLCPDLTDDKWKYGSSEDDLFRTISMGRPGGMPKWNHLLSEKEIKDVIEYIKSLKKP